MKWYERIILAFRQKQYRTETRGVLRIRVSYKVLFGREFEISRWVLPPQHFNCRSVMLPSMPLTLSGDRTVRAAVDAAIIRKPEGDEEAKP